MRDATPAVRTATAERSLTPERDYAGVFNLGLYRRHRGTAIAKALASPRLVELRDPPSVAVSAPE
jgi:hypothetical protein